MAYENTVLLWWQDLSGVHALLRLLAGYAVMFTVAQSKLPVWSELRDILQNKSLTFSRLCQCSFCSGFWAGACVHGLALLGRLAASEGALAAMVAGGDGAARAGLFALWASGAWGLVSASFCYVLDVAIRRLEG